MIKAIAFLPLLLLSISGISCGRIRPESAIEQVDGTVEDPNGNEVSPSGEKLYVLDSGGTVPIGTVLGNFYEPASFSELTNKADTIVIGEAVDSVEESPRIVTRGSSGLLTTWSSVSGFRVDDVLKGNPTVGETIPIRQFISLLNGEEYGHPKPDNQPNRRLSVLGPPNNRPMRKGKKYILFAIEDNGEYGIVGFSYGRVNIDGEDELRPLNDREGKIHGYARALSRRSENSRGRGPDNGNGQGNGQGNGRPEQAQGRGRGLISEVVAESASDFADPTSEVDLDAVETDPIFDNVLDNTPIELPPDTVEKLPPVQP